MSIAEVTSRIATIQAQLAQLSPTQFAPTRATGTSGVASTSGTAFEQALQTATTALTDSATDRVIETATQGTSAEAKAVVDEAKKYLGLPYVWGGTDPEKGLDCSGLVQLVYKNMGYDLPRVSNQQAEAGRRVASMDQAQPGDLIAWDNSSRNKGVDHIAIYIGDGKMIEAPRRGLDVRIIDVPSTPDVIRRVIPDAPAQSRTSAADLTSLQALSSLVGMQLSGTYAGSGSGTSTGSGAEFSALFAAAGVKHGVSPQLLTAMARQESSFDPNAVSPAGAQGLMQLMPATAQSLGVTDSFDASQSVDGAARLMRTLLDRFGSTDLALAAYNAGPGAVIRHDGVPPYAETQNYVRSITSALGGTR